MAAAKLTWRNAIQRARAKFITIGRLSETRVTYGQEATFANEIIKGNPYLQECDPESIIEAFLCVASTGVSLDPTKKLAYLVARNNRAALDISYQGLVKIATDSGSVMWAQAVLVHEKDVFKLVGIDKEPIHEYDPLRPESRGMFIGAYCVAKLHNGDYMTEVMTNTELEQISKLSMSADSAWVNWTDQMRKKTVIKRASNTWPKTDRLSKAIHIVNQHEGIDFGPRESSVASEVKQARTQTLKQKMADKINSNDNNEENN